MLKLAEKNPVAVAVAFFDTRDSTLAAKNVILRVRREAGTPGQSTVKIRADSAAEPSDDLELSMPAEFDWMSPDAPEFSRSLNHTLPPNQLDAVVSRTAQINTLFNSRQQHLLTSTCPEFSWEKLLVFGPVQAEVWDKQSKLKGFPKPISVERWHLERDGRKSEILEVSVKVSTSSEAEAKQLAAAFYQAAEDAGFGPAQGLSKTQIVMDFFRPAP